ncbi:MAG: uroporphyrinogen-III C-methyltransferase [Selenomonadales bacterium]|nr:uroporphyrinogen-III C-methyltransferase [Selenomonadales bacterium]
MKGKVYLIGAGPGDYKLITMRGLEYLQQAEVVVYDRLADNRLLAYAPENAEMIYVGKASANHTMKQEDINQLLVDKALEGKTVVRLKGGDPFVFGRGGEEALLLVENDVPFEIVPGISSSIAVPAYAGIPVTHRGIAASFAVVTGHEDPTKTNSSIYWQNLAKATDTLVFLMGVENLPYITKQLVEIGRSADTPAAVIRWGTKPEQRTLVTTLGNAAEDVKKHGIKPPAIFLVGHVATLREKLAWFDTRPLFGQTVLVTRAREQASALTAQLESLGAACIEAPSIKIEAPSDGYAGIDAAISTLDTYEWVIFTSVNGVKHFFARMKEAGKDSRALAGIRICAIGSKTAEEVAKHGLIADIVPAEFRAEGIVEAMKEYVSEGTKILLARAKEARNVLPEELTKRGALVTIAEAYRTVVASTNGDELADMLREGKVDWVTFTSSSTVTNLVSLLGEGGADLIRQTKVACIGPITAATCAQYDIKPTVMADEYTISGLVQKIEAYYHA